MLAKLKQVFSMSEVLKLDVFDRNRSTKPTLAGNKIKK